MIRGEIRINPETGEAALCTELHGVRYWAPLIIPPKRADGMQEQVDSVEGWTVAYSPKPDTSLLVEVMRPPLGPKPNYVRTLGEAQRGSDWIDQQGDVWRWIGGLGEAWRWRHASEPDSAFSRSNRRRFVPADFGPYREVVK